MIKTKHLWQFLILGTAWQLMTPALHLGQDELLDALEIAKRDISHLTSQSLDGTIIPSNKLAEKLPNSKITFQVCRTDSFSRVTIRFPIPSPQGTRVIQMVMWNNGAWVRGAVAKFPDEERRPKPSLVGGFDSSKVNGMLPSVMFFLGHYAEKDRPLKFGTDAFWQPDQWHLDHGTLKREAFEGTIFSIEMDHDHIAKFKLSPSETKERSGFADGAGVDVISVTYSIPPSWWDSGSGAFSIEYKYRNNGQTKSTTQECLVKQRSGCDEAGVPFNEIWVEDGDEVKVDGDEARYEYREGRIVKVIDETS